MANFEKLCKLIIDTNGLPNIQDVLDCGYSMENFIRLSRSAEKPERLVKNAREALLARGIHYKEAM